MNARLVIVALALSALIHVLPLPGLLGGEGLQALYGLATLDQAGELLLRHRAWMFALDAALLVWAIRRPELRWPAIVLTLASDVGFLLLGVGGLPAGLVKIAVADAASVLLLLSAAVVHARAGGA